MIVPDGIEPIRAARVWAVHQGYLCPVTGVGWYPVGRPLAAVCVRAGHRRVPDERCACGIYGVADPADLSRRGYLLSEPYPTTATRLVAGVIELWGRIACGSRGWRAGYGRPAGLVRSRATVPFRLGPGELDRVALRYGIPVLADWPELTLPVASAA